MQAIAPQSRSVRKLLVALDAALIVVSLVSAMAERPFLARILPLQGLPASLTLKSPEYVFLLILTVPVWLTFSARLGMHTVLEAEWTLPRIASRLGQLHMFGFLAVATLTYATQTVVNRSLVGLFIANSYLLMLLCYGSLSAWRRFQYRRGTARTRLLLVGDQSEALSNFVHTSQRVDYSPLIVGRLVPPDLANAATEGEDGIPILGSAEDMERVLHETPLDAVLFFPPFDRMNQAVPALHCCEVIGVPALLAVDMEGHRQLKPRLVSMCGSPFVSLESTHKREELLAVKHLFDWCCAAAAIFLLSPVLLGAWLAIFLTMGAPVLFAQERAGLRGRPFRMLKFRTMVADAEQRKVSLLDRNEMAGPVFKMEQDPRITPLGRFLRKTSIDELPQLFHVLLGTMSLVGPRPLPMLEQQQIHGWHRRRLAMRPGITGLWQVSGRSDVDFDKWMELDLKYVDEWSLWNDLKIALKTIPVVLSQKGAR